MWRWLCPHRHRTRQRHPKTDVYLLVCSACDDAVPMLDRSPTERKAIKKMLGAVPKLTAKRATRNNVEWMPKAWKR